MRTLLIAAAALLLTAPACEQQKSKLDDLTSKPVGSAGSAGGAPADNAINIDSKDILDRKESVPEAQVKHILIAWKDLDSVYQGRMDPRAQKRTNEEAAKLAQELAAKLKANPDSIDALIKEHSEDPGSLS